jgi:hypothetical protein
MGLSCPQFKEAMFFQMDEKFSKVRFDELSIYAECAADLLHDLCFGIPLLQKLKHPRCDQVQPKHLPVADVEDDGSVLVVS